MLSLLEKSIRLEGKDTCQAKTVEDGVHMHVCVQMFSLLGTCIQTGGSSTCLYHLSHKLHIIYPFRREASTFSCFLTEDKSPKTACINTAVHNPLSPFFISTFTFDNCFWQWVCYYSNGLLFHQMSGESGRQKSAETSQRCIINLTLVYCM